MQNFVESLTFGSHVRVDEREMTFFSIGCSKHLLFLLILFSISYIDMLGKRDVQSDRVALVPDLRDDKHTKLPVEFSVHHA